MRALAATGNTDRLVETAAVSVPSPAETLNRIPSARTIARLLTTSRDNLTKSKTVTIATIEGGIPLLVKARDIIADFHRVIRRKAENELAPWIDRAREGLVASFGNGVAKDI